MNCCDNINGREKGHICIPTGELPRIIIIGGDFAGFNLVKNLKNQPVQVVPFDRNNYHQFIPLLFR
jgi:NADH dehydrogenase